MTRKTTMWFWSVFTLSSFAVNLPLTWAIGNHRINVLLAFALSGISGAVTYALMDSIRMRLGHPVTTDGYLLADDNMSLRQVEKLPTTSA